MKIDFVSDIVCPWCAIGLNALERAIARLDDAVEVEIHFQPFELNPQMPPEGEEIIGHLTRKYGLLAEDVERNAEAIRQRGESVGFVFGRGKRRRTYNSFDAHRLLYWAGDAGHQHALKHALLGAYFTDGENPSDHAVLARVAGSAGLDVDVAKAILASDRYAVDVRAREKFYVDQGIHAVPSVIVDDRHLIQGGQPVEVFEKALRDLA